MASNGWLHWITAHRRTKQNWLGCGKVQKLVASLVYFIFIQYRKFCSWIYVLYDILITRVLSLDESNTIGMRKVMSTYCGHARMNINLEMLVNSCANASVSSLIMIYHCITCSVCFHIVICHLAYSVVHDIFAEVQSLKCFIGYNMDIKCNI